MIFGIKEKSIFDPYNVLLAIATNIPQRLKTGFVVQGHTHTHTHTHTHIYIYSIYIIYLFIFYKINGQM